MVCSKFSVKTYFEQLHVSQNAAAKLLTKSFKFSTATPILKKLHCLPVYFTVHFKMRCHGELLMDKNQTIIEGTYIYMFLAGP